MCAICKDFTIVEGICPHRTCRPCERKTDEDEADADADDACRSLRQAAIQAPCACPPMVTFISLVLWVFPLKPAREGPIETLLARVANVTIGRCTFGVPSGPPGR